MEAKNAETPIERKPSWIRTTAKMGPNYTDLQNIVKTGDLHTVCQEAGCPNIYECWEDRESTFLIGGDQCTRRCDFCQIESAKPENYDPAEPLRVAASVMPQAMMLLKRSAELSTLSAKPCMVVRRETRTPMAQILRSGSVSVAASQTPVRPSTRVVAMPYASSRAMIAASRRRT